EAQAREARTAGEASGRGVFAGRRRGELHSWHAPQRAAVDYWRERAAALSKLVAGVGPNGLEDREAPQLKGADPTREINQHLDVAPRAPEGSDPGLDWEPGW